MLATSNEIIAAWLNHSRQLSIRVKIDSVTYGSEEITSLSFDSGSISGEVFQIGSTYMNSVQIVFPSIIESIAEDIEVIPELGVMVNGSYEYTKLGHFFIDDFDRNKNNKTTSITATDKMRFMEGEYVSKLTYPKAYREVALDVANSAGVEVSANSFASLGTGAINQPEGYTHRQAIGLIAQFEGGFASFNRNGELEIRRLAPTTFEITPESYLLKGFTKNEASYRIGGISVKTGEEETDVIRVGSTNGSQVELENKIMTQTLLNQMWELVKTLNYFPYELKWRGCPPLEAGDWIYISDKDGNKYSVPNLSYSITFNGGMSAESKALTSSTSQATYKYRGSLNQKIDYLDSILSSNNWNTNYYDQTEPSNPKEGDIWFKPNGQDTEIWVYKNIDGVLKWVMEISSAVDPDLLQAIEDAKKAGQDAQLAAEEAKTAADDAKEVGEEAKQAGETAQLVANEAKNAAADAKQAGEDAHKVGEDAKSAADNAKIAADDAKAVGENAQLAAIDAKQAGENAAILAGQAQETADDVNQRIGDVVIDIGDIQGDINAIVNDVGDVQTDISKIISDATATTSKANDAFNKASAVEGRTSTLETSVGSIKSTMTDIEMDLDSTTKKINEVSTTVDGQKSEIASVKTTANSALSKANTVETSVDSVKTTLTSVQEWQNNLAISGRNLVRKTGFENNEYPFTGILGNPERGLETVDGVLAYKIQHSHSSSTQQGVYFAKSSLTIPPAIGDTFVFSVIVKGTGLFSNMRFEQADNSKTWGGTAIPTEWTRVYITGVHTGTSGAFIFYIRENTVLYIKEKSLKIESGTISTDWSPAPEDLATVTKVNELTTTVDGNTSKIASVETTATSALSKANVAQSTADGNTTKIIAAQTTANSALTKANTVEQTVDGVKSTLTSVQESVSDVINLFPDPNLTKQTPKPVNESSDTSYTYDANGLIVTNSSATTERRIYWGVNQGIQLLVGKTYLVKVLIQTGTTGGTIKIGTSEGENLEATPSPAIETWVEGTIKVTKYTALSFWLWANRTLRIKRVQVYEFGAGTSTKAINQISDTVDGHTQLIASTTTTANSALTKATNVEATVNGLKTTVSSVETIANSALTKATSVEQTANGLTTTVTSVKESLNNLGGRNLLVRTGEATGKGLTGAGSNPGTSTVVYPTPGNLAGASTMKEAIKVTPGKKYTFQKTGSDYWRYNWLDSSYAFISRDVPTSEKFTVTAPTNAVYLWVSYPTNADVKIEEGDTATGFSLAPEDTATSSQITQLSDQMNFKLTSSDGGVTQIDMQNKIVTIASENIYLTGKSYISDAVIKTAHIVDLAVSTAKISDLAVSEGKIGNLAVTNAKIANLSVTEGKIGDAAITNAKIGNLAVSEGKIANLAVTNAKIASLAVTEGKIGDAAITNAKIGNLAVSEAKIADLAVSSAKIANLAVTETKIGDAAITNAKIGDLAVSTAKIADAAITDAKIGNLSATKITTGTLNAANVNIINLNASNITTGTISGANLSINLATGSVLFSKGKIANSSGTFSLDIDNDEYYSQGYVNGASSEKAMTVLKSGTLRTAFELNKTTGQITKMLVLGNNALRSYVPKSSSGILNPLSEVYDTNNQKTVDFNFGATSDSDKTRYGFVSLELYKVSNGGTNSLGGMPYMQIHGQNQAITLSAQSKIELNTWSTITLDAKRTDINSGGDATSYGGLSLGNDSSGGRVWSIAIYNRTYAAGNGDICITSAGTLGRKTSARKYKADIKTADDVIAHAKEFLTIQPASWYDKKDYLKGTAEDRFYGFIADEFHEKGLTEVVYYGDKGQVEGLAYDRLTMYQNVILSEHEQEIQRLKIEVSNLKTKVEELEAA